MKKIRWGVLGTAKIAREKVIPALRQCAYGELRAVASRSLERSQAFAQQLGIPLAYGSYEALLADPDIDAIYNPLPNDQHVPLTLQAARAGKHVLCEKPMGMTADEVDALREVAQQVHIMEAFMVRFHPQWQRVRQRVQAGELGEVRTVQASFSYFNQNPDNIRNQLAHGGGALYDIGCYPVVIGRYLFGCEPQRVVSLLDRDPVFGTDRCASALLDFGGGRRLELSVSTQRTPYQRVQVLGTRGRIEVCIPFNSPLGGSTELLSDATGALDGSTLVRETLAPCNMYTLQFDAFCKAVLGEQPLPYGVDDALANMRVLDALFASDRLQQWIAL